MSNKILLKNLEKFLKESGKSDYSSSNSNNWTKEKDGSTTIKYKSGGWKYHDNFFGGEPYGGRIVVHYKEKPVWIFVYYGWVKPFVKDMQKVYDFLRMALNADPKNKIFRGPKQFTHGKFKYYNSYEGSLENFSGEEIILWNKKEIYKAKYIGGLVDQR
jgi:hypothetical protein